MKNEGRYLGDANAKANALTKLRAGWLSQASLIAIEPYTTHYLRIPWIEIRVPILVGFFIMVQPPEIRPELIFHFLWLVEYRRLLLGGIPGLAENCIELAFVPHLLLALGHVSIPLHLESIQCNLESLVWLVVFIQVNKNANGRRTALAASVFDEIDLIFGRILFLSNRRVLSYVHAVNGS